MKINDGESEYVLKRSQRVKVNHQYGAIVPSNAPEWWTDALLFTEDSIVWAGTGGYWCWTDKSNVCAIRICQMS
jgi:hypothetical protein